MRYLIVAVGLVALFPLTTAAQSIEGVWQRTEIVFAGGPATVRSTQPGLSIITDTHIAALEDNGQALRTTLNSPSDDEILAALVVYTAAAGPYEMNGSTITFTPTTAANPNQINTAIAAEIAFDGNDSFTSVITNPNGATQTRKYTRVK